MIKYTFLFYRDDKVIASKSFVAESKEMAFRMADMHLKDNPYDDWEFYEQQNN